MFLSSISLGSLLASNTLDATEDLAHPLSIYSSASNTPVLVLEILVRDLGALLFSQLLAFDCASGMRKSSAIYLPMSFVNNHQVFARMLLRTLLPNGCLLVCILHIAYDRDGSIYCGVWDTPFYLPWRLVIYVATKGKCPKLYTVSPLTSPSLANIDMFPNWFIALEVRILILHHFVGISNVMIIYCAATLHEVNACLKLVSGDTLKTLLLVVLVHAYFVQADINTFGTVGLTFFLLSAKLGAIVLVCQFMELRFERPSIMVVGLYYSDLVPTNLVDLCAGLWGSRSMHPVYFQIADVERFVQNFCGHLIVSESDQPHGYSFCTPMSLDTILIACRTDRFRHQVLEAATVCLTGLCKLIHSSNTVLIAILVRDGSLVADQKFKYVNENDIMEVVFQNRICLICCKLDLDSIAIMLFGHPVNGIWMTSSRYIDYNAADWHVTWGWNLFWSISVTQKQDSLPSQHLHCKHWDPGIFLSFLDKVGLYGVHGDIIQSFWFQCWWTKSFHCDRTNYSMLANVGMMKQTGHKKLERLRCYCKGGNVKLCVYDYFPYEHFSNEGLVHDILNSKKHMLDMGQCWLHCQTLMHFNQGSHNVSNQILALHTLLGSQVFMELSHRDHTVICLYGKKKLSMGIVNADIMKSCYLLMVTTGEANAFNCEFSIFQPAEFIPWDPGEHIQMFKVLSSCQSKQWDPGKFTHRENFYNLEDKVDCEGVGNDMIMGLMK